MTKADTLLEQAIEDSILDVRKDYIKNRWRYLSEGDVVCKIFSELEKRLSTSTLCSETEPRFYPHAEIRPYIVDENGIQVLKEEESGDVSWEKKDDRSSENSSGRIDLVVIKKDDGFEEALSNAIDKQCKNDIHKELKFARILSYPLDSLAAVIEVKVKVRDNKNRILTDLKKLEEIKKRHPGCIAKMVVFDYCAQGRSPGSVEEIKNAVEKLLGRVKCYCYYGDK